MILLNAMTIYVGADAAIGSVTRQAVQILDVVFLLFYLVEITLRYKAFRIAKDCLKDFWFKYDTFLVALMIGETIATWTNVILLLEMTPGVGETIRPALNGYHRC